MVADVINYQSIFPDYPREQPAVDKQGNFNALLDIGLGALFQALQENYKNEGIRIPLLSASNMTLIQNLYNAYVGGPYNTLTMAQPDISGQTVFDKTMFTMNQFVIGQDAASPPNATLAQWMPFAMITNSTVSPDLVLAGVLNWLCYDTVHMALYICTTAGAAGVARWTQIT